MQPGSSSISIKTRMTPVLTSPTGRGRCEFCERRVRVHERSECKRDRAQQVIKVTTPIRPSPNPLPEGEGFITAQGHMCLKTLEILDYLRNRLSQITRRHEIECPWPQRLHEFFEFVKHIIDAQAEAKMVEAA